MAPSLSLIKRLIVLRRDGLEKVSIKLIINRVVLGFIRVSADLISLSKGVLPLTSRLSPHLDRANSEISLSGSYYTLLFS